MSFTIFRKEPTVPSMSFEIVLGKCHPLLHSFLRCSFLVFPIVLHCRTGYGYNFFKSLPSIWLDLIPVRDSCCYSRVFHRIPHLFSRDCLLCLLFQNSPQRQLELFYDLPHIEGESDTLRFLTSPLIRIFPVVISRTFCLKLVKNFAASCIFSMLLKTHSRKYSAFRLFNCWFVH